MRVESHLQVTPVVCGRRAAKVAAGCYMPTLGYRCGHVRSVSARLPWHEGQVTHRSIMWGAKSGLRAHTALHNSGSIGLSGVRWGAKAMWCAL